MLNTTKVCLSVDSKLYTSFKKKYPHTLRQGVEVLMRRSIRYDDFLWNFINGCLLDDLKTISVSNGGDNENCCPQESHC